MRKLILFVFLSLTMSITGWAQCLTNVDFNTWSQAGNPNNGTWTVQGGGSSVRQTTNGANTFYISPFELINVRITGNFRSTDDDDDWMGFVFSFLDPIGNSTNYNGWLFDWKKGQQGNAPRGMALCRMNGQIAGAQESQAFGDHVDIPGVFTVVQNDFGGPGWNKNFNHAFTLELTFTRATIYVDGNLVFDQQDCFLPGYFGFYNRSQRDCYYSNFQYDLFVDFVVLTDQICPYDTAQFQFYDPCIGFNFDFNQYVSLTWDFGDGSPPLVNNNPSVANVNATHVYTQPGTYNVTLTVEDTQGCQDDATRQITILAPPSLGFTNTPTCDGSAMDFTFTGGGNPAFWQWDFGDQSALDNNQNPSHTYPNDGDWDVTLVASANGCFDTLTQTVTVDPGPTAGFTAVSPPCSGLPVEFTDNSVANGGTTLTGWSWDFGDGNPAVNGQVPVYAYALPGNYTVSQTVTTNNGCTDTYTEQVTVSESPTVDFTWTDACLNDGIDFVGNAQVNGGVINTWAWDYDGDQVPDDLIQSPSHVFASAGIHTVGLGVIADNGCPNYAVHDVEVYAEPTADFDFVNVCNGNNIDLMDVSSGGNIVQWDWDLGGLSTDQNQNVSYDFNGVVGTHDVNLTVTTDNGCTDDTTQTVELFAVPTADFSFSDVCRVDPAIFTDNSTISSGSITNWLWDFGELPNSTQQNPTHEYSSANTYTVYLTVTSDHGCTDVIDQDIEVFPIPQAAFSATTECLTDVTQFTDQTNVTSGTIVGWDWEFDDGNESTDQNPTNPYLNPGTYDVFLEVTSDNGCKSSVTNPVVVHPLPEPDFSSTSVCLGETTEFSDLSTILTGSIANYDWDFGDGSANSSASDPTHDYDPAGFYDVILTLTSDNGCQDEITHPVEVYALPEVMFTSDKQVGCQPFTVNFFDESTIAAGYNIVQWAWDLGNSTANAQFPSTVYPESGTYSVTLETTSGEGCKSSHTEQYYITCNPKPKAGFSASPQPTNLLYPFIQFTDNASSDVIDWVWNFGDGGSSIEQNPSHTYNTNDTFDVSQYVYNQYGCGDSIYDIIIIDPAFTLYVPNAFTPNEDGYNDIFTAKGLDVGIQKYTLRIFNRWGEQLFESYQLDKGWDGTVHGGIDQAPVGVYLYRIDAVNLTGEEFQFNGKVSLIR